LEQVYLNPSFLVLLSILLIATFVNPMGQVSQYAAQGNYIDKPLFRHALIFTVFSFIIANFGLNKIISLSIPVLMFLYPLAITLIILSLLAPIIKKQKHIYRWTTTLTMIAAFFDFCNALPETIKGTEIMSKIIDFAHLYLPGFDYGFGWIIPALVGFVIGTVIWKTPLGHTK
jgi:LIVCS family branched-chain amino acid:cation transporter